MRQTNAKTLAKHNQQHYPQSSGNLNFTTRDSEWYQSFGGIEDLTDRPINKKALVMSLDKTLFVTQSTPPQYPHIGVLLDFMAFENIVYVARRPGLREFLARMTRFYDIYIFTTNTREYTTAMLDALSIKDYFTAIFDRKDCNIVKGPLLVKDLSRLGVPLENIVLIDDSSIQTSRYYENSIKIPTFTGDVCDRSLMDLSPFLEKLALTSDVRPVARKMAIYRDGGDINAARAHKTEENSDNSPKRLFNKFLDVIFSRNSQEAAQHQGRFNPLDTSAAKKVPQLRSTGFLGSFMRTGRNVNKFGMCLTQRDFSGAVMTSEELFEEGIIDFFTPRFCKRSIDENEDESDYSDMMDETSQGQIRKNFLVPSLPMRTKTTRLVIF